MTMRTVIINPGSGPVAGGTARQAVRNVAAFVRDLKLAGVAIGCPVRDESGRYAFRLVRGRRKCDIDMPGIALKRVRYIGRTQNPFDFPRLYVDGSSWLWRFAVDIARDELDR